MREFTYYVLENDKGLVGLDEASGGYPYNPTDFRGVNLFTEDDVKKEWFASYLQGTTPLRLRKVRITLEDVDGPVEKPAPRLADYTPTGKTPDQCSLDELNMMVDKIRSAGAVRAITVGRLLDELCAVAEKKGYESVYDEQLFTDHFVRKH
jgi:hypothetical protein